MDTQTLTARRLAARDALSIPRSPMRAEIEIEILDEIDSFDEMDAPSDWNAGAVIFDPYL